MKRTSEGTLIQNEPTIQEIIANLSNGYRKTFFVYVEDKFSKRLFTELIREFKPELLDAISIAHVGNKTDVAWAVEKTRLHKGLTVVGVRDEADTQDTKRNIFAYPSTLPPEKVIFSNPEVEKYLLERYRVNLSEIIKEIPDHHDYPGKLAERCHLEEDVVATVCIQEFVRSSAGEDYRKFVESIAAQCQ